MANKHKKVLKRSEVKNMRFYFLPTNIAMSENSNIDSIEDLGDLFCTLDESVNCPSPFGEQLVVMQ